MSYKFSKFVKNPDDTVSVVFKDAAGVKHCFGLNEFAREALPLTHAERTRVAVQIIDSGYDYNFRPMTEAEARSMSYA